MLNKDDCIFIQTVVSLELPGCDGQKPLGPRFCRVTGARG